MVEKPVGLEERDWAAPVQDLARALRRDRVVLALIAAYALVAAGLAAAFERTYLPAFVDLYVSGWGGIAVGVLLAAAVGQIVLGLLRDKPVSPLVHAVETLQSHCTPERLGGLAVFLGLCVFMGAFTTVKTLLPSIQPFWADAHFADLDKAIHFGRDPWTLLQPLLGHRAVTQLIEVAYGPGWLLMTSILPIWMCVFCRDAQLRRRYLLAFLICWIVNGTILAGIFMSGGPAYFAELAADTARFADQIAYLSQDMGPFSAIGVQNSLWAARLSDGPSVGAGISAFPSLHVTMAALATLTVWKINRALGAVMLLFAGVILIGSVHLAWHFAVDGYAGIVLTLAIWWGCGRLVSSLASAAD